MQDDEGQVPLIGDALQEPRLLLLHVGIRRSLDEAKLGDGAGDALDVLGVRLIGDPWGCLCQRAARTLGAARQYGIGRNGGAPPPSRR
jgi:hypothetical protein